MASESSSAVLELNDADATDTEAPSVIDDAHDATPLIMEHGYDIAVKVDAPMKQLSTLETFVTYRVRCVCARWSTPPYVRRRYNHFKLLHKRLSAAHPLVAAPPLPPLHSARQQLDRYSPVFVAVRCLALHAFLERVAKHPILTHSEDFRLFLTTPDDDLDKVFKSENSALNLWGLSTALYGGGESKPANGARVKDPEFSSAADYLQSLQQKLTTLCVLTSKLYKGSVSLSTELMGMRRVCDAWAVQAGGRCGAAVAGCGVGASAAATPRARAPLKYRATLPLLAAYAGAHLDKIRNRDALHAAYVAGNNATDEVHNRLEQASEALRSELSDWIPKTRTEIRSLLLELADRQVTIHTQALMGWEHALKLSTEDISEMFKTVSKSAVQNLSPTKCRNLMTPETERDIDDIDIENYSNDSDIQDVSHLDISNIQDDFKSEVGEKSDLNYDKSVKSDLNYDKSDLNCVKSDLNGDKSDLKSVESDQGVSNGEKLDLKEESPKFSDPLKDFSEVDLS
ncbi:sorting nexin-7-like [Maniola jurtina]|uniref:sorting nexin-7-like n=1 Tax=Maniola jurtina TaxID=191418 RepID=UPI001E68EC3D|nr:sorting nexin-7-like [Maniola jurtina]XP_045782127.1 sorting nexin-7-like [Maniola jurtina]